MTYVARRPSPPLAPFVEQLWHFEDVLPLRRERIMPTGAMALLVNLHEDELRSYHGDGYREVRRIRGACVVGAQGAHFAIDTLEQRAVVGVELRPGGAAPFLRMPTDAVADLHVDLGDVWGRDGEVLRERLLEAETVDERLDILDAALLERVVRPFERDRGVDRAIAAFEQGAAVATVADTLGITERTLHRRFTAAVGLTPKRFARVRRFQRVLAAVEGKPGAVDWAGVAAGTGYFDQAHLIHEFRELAGVTPTAYLPLASDTWNHVPIDPVDDALSEFSNPALSERGMVAP